MGDAVYVVLADFGLNGSAILAARSTKPTAEELKAHQAPLRSYTGYSGDSGSASGHRRRRTGGGVLA